MSTIYHEQRDGFTLNDVESAGRQYLVFAFNGLIPEPPEHEPVEDERPADLNLCSECGGSGSVDLTPGVTVPWLQEDGPCSFCEGTGVLA